MLKKAVASLLTLFLLMSLGPVAAFAQTETGQLNVKAADPQGAVVPGATVTVKSVERGTESTNYDQRGRHCHQSPICSPACMM